jgi:Acyl-CoA reductase (LuxC)
MNLKQRINLLAELGDYLQQTPDEAFSAVIRRSHIENQWFTEENVLQSIHAIATTFLNKNALENWTKQYKISEHPHPKHNIGLIMAGNIPLVGFHDWLCVFIFGQRAVVKLSSQDQRLLPFLVQKMGEWAHESREYTHFTSNDDRFSGFDAIIATGSNNTSRYFEQYFAKYPNIIRKNRNSIAVLDGTETPEELFRLGADFFTYFGLGCRNVSKIYVPEKYDFDRLLEATHEYRAMIMHNKYKNNFDYNFTLYILNKIKHYSNGCILLTENPDFTSRISSVNFEYYSDKVLLDSQLSMRKEEIQCLVSKVSFPSFETIKFGETQTPSLTDYADGVDTMSFIEGL